MIKIEHILFKHGAKECVLTAEGGSVKEDAIKWVGNTIPHILMVKPFIYTKL